MKRILLVIFMLTGTVATMPSCSDWLNLEPNDGVVEKDYWKSKEEVHSAVIGCYTSLLKDGLVRRMVLWGEVRADLLTMGPTVITELLNITRGEIATNNSWFTWSDFYTTINYCNKVIENAVTVYGVDQTFTKKLYDQYVAEVTTIRCLMYFYLVRSFQDVPFVLKASDNDQQDYYPSNTRGAVILDSLLAQLQRVQNALPTDYGSADDNKGRITYYTNIALQADIMLWQGSYMQCEELCEQIINSGKYSLVPMERDSVEIFDRNGVFVEYAHTVKPEDMDVWFNELYVKGNSVESIFELQYPETHPSWADPFYGMFNSAVNRPQMAPNEVLLNEWLFPVYEFDATIKDIRTFTYQKGYVWKYTGLSLSGTEMRTTRTYPHLIIYRLADIMLMRAEALTALAIPGNDQTKLEEAYAIVKQVRARSNAIETASTRFSSPINGKALESFILDERGRELLFEGKRWYDVLRYAKREDNQEYFQAHAVRSTPPDKVASLQAKYASPLWLWFCYWPIHLSTVEMNKNLVQNEYYQLIGN